MKISKIDGVESAAGGLTLNSLHIEGTVPEQQQQPGQFGGPGSGGGGPPRNINATSLSVSGVDQAQKALGAVTPGQIVTGHYFGIVFTRPPCVRAACNCESFTYTSEDCRQARRLRDPDDGERLASELDGVTDREPVT